MLRPYTLLTCTLETCSDPFATAYHAIQTSDRSGVLSAKAAMMTKPPSVSYVYICTARGMVAKVLFKVFSHRTPLAPFCMTGSDHNLITVLDNMKVGRDFEIALRINKDGQIRCSLELHRPASPAGGRGHRCTEVC